MSGFRLELMAPMSARVRTPSTVGRPLSAATVAHFRGLQSRESSRKLANGGRMRETEDERGCCPCCCPCCCGPAVPCHGDGLRGCGTRSGLQRSKRPGGGCCIWRSANRRRRCSRCAERYDGVDAGRVLVVAGTSAGFTLAFLTLFEPGDRVGVLEPGRVRRRRTHRRDRHPRRTARRERPLRTPTQCRGAAAPRLSRIRV